MNWLSSVQDTEEATFQAFETVRELPNHLTTRVRALTAADEEQKQASLDLDLKAFPPLYKSETKEQREKRMRAYDSSWTQLEVHNQKVLEVANAETFQQLAKYAFQQHVSPHKRRSTAATRQRIIPAALAVAGSVCAADHSETFPALVKELEQQGCYAALLGPRDLIAGGAVAPALLSILRQFSGLSTDADDMQALLAWYKDELEARPQEQQQGHTSPTDAILLPLGKMGLKTPSKTPRKGRRTEDESADHSKLQETDSIASPFGKMALQTPQTRKLRPRTQASPEDQANPAAKDEEGYPSSLQAFERPLIVVIDEAESLNSLVLQDLILVLSENHADLPVTLILGMATSAAALAQILPAAASDMLAPRSFQLVQAMSKLETVFREVLLSDAHRLSFGHSLIQALDDRFMHHDFTVRTLQQGLKLACLTHFQSSPLSFLVAVPDETLETECAGLPKPLLKQALQQLGLSSRTPDAALAKDIRLSLVEQSKWRLCILWMKATAAATGHKTMCDGFSLRELYRDASASSFSKTARGKALLHSLERRLPNLSLDQGLKLLETLQAAAKARLHRDAWLEDQDSKIQSLIAEYTAAKTATEREELPEQATAQQPAVASTEVAEETAASQPEIAGDADVATVAGAQKAGSLKIVHSAASRRELLANSFAVTKPSALSVLGRAKAAQSTPAAALAAKIWTLLESAIPVLDKPPGANSGAAAFCVEDRSKSRSQLALAPRTAINRALALPECYLGGDSLGMCPQQHDTSIAYQLLTEHGEEVDVTDWFAEFCAIYQTTDVTHVEEEGEPSPPKKARRGRPKGSKKVLQNEEADAAAAATAAKARATRKTAKQNGTKDAPTQNSDGNPSCSAEAPQVPEFRLPFKELVARFTQSTNELQLMGIVKAAIRKRRGRYAQRLVWGMPGVAESTSA